MYGYYKRHVPMSWEMIEREIGPEPGVAWDRDVESQGWQPRFYLAATESIGPGFDKRAANYELRAHCPMHRAADLWPVPDTSDIALVMRCRCARWGDAESGWVPRFSKADRDRAYDLALERDLDDAAREFWLNANSASEGRHGPLVARDGNEMSSSCSSSQV